MKQAAHPQYQATQADSSATLPEKSFSPARWWSIALTINLLIVLCVLTVKETRLTPEGYQFNSPSQGDWFLFLILSLSILAPSGLGYQVQRILWLRKYGVIGKGIVVAHRRSYTNKGRIRVVSVIEFRPRGAQTPIYQVEHWAWGEPLPKRRRVQILYDPSNPGGCAQVGFADGDLLVYTILGVLLVGLPIFIITCQFSSS